MSKRDLSVTDGGNTSARSGDPKVTDPSDTSLNGGHLQTHYLKGWKLRGLIFALCMSFFLANMDVTIVGTSLLTIANSLDGFHKASAISASYLMAWASSSLIIARLSDVLGRKILISLSLFTFIISSIASGTAQTIDQLILFRTFQGIGGGGILTLTFIILIENVSPADYPRCSGIVSSVLALSNLLGPILGGILSTNGKWTWIFYLNVPAGSLALLLLQITLPHDQKPQHRWRIIDWIGALFIISFNFPLVKALERIATQLSWTNAVKPLIVLSFGLLTYVILARHLPKKSERLQRTSNWDLASFRFALGLSFNAFFMGSIFVSSIVFFPLQSQLVFQDSPEKAGYRLLWVTLTPPLFAAVAGFLTQKRGTPPLYVFIGAQVIEVLGCFLMSSVPQQIYGFPAAQYGYQVIMGAGMGLALSTITMAAPLAFSKQNLAIGMGTTNQMRALGSSLGVVIGLKIISSTIAQDLRLRLTESQFSALQASADAIRTFPPHVQEKIREVFALGFTMLMRAFTGLAVAGLVLAFVMVERRPRFQDNKGVGIGKPR